jgi:hypothetical protein
MSSVRHGKVRSIICLSSDAFNIFVLSHVMIIIIHKGNPICRKRSRNKEEHEFIRCLLLSTIPNVQFL